MSKIIWRKFSYPFLWKRIKILAAAVSILKRKVEEQEKEIRDLKTLLEKNK